jgi:hypothetical protein
MMKEELRACFEREEDINSVSVNSYQYMIAALQETAYLASNPVKPSTHKRRLLY